MSSKTISSTSSRILSPSAALFAAAKAKDIPDLVKPYKNEAVIRLRNSTVSLVTLTVITYLLPVPSLWTALNIVRGSHDKGFLWGICATELALSALLALNLIQAAYALKYPRRSLPPLPSSPAKGLITPQSQKKRRTILSPGTSPQPQRSSSLYASSPISTPSRTLYYSMPSTPSPFNVSIGSSTTSLPPTPSPSLSAYQARHASATGQSFDGLTLSQLADDDGDDDEDC
ncbi:hypothetical protein V8B97DRAFT_2069823 [Scleroderma yunnanense]